MNKPLAPSNQLAAQIMYTALSLLSAEHQMSMRGSQLLALLPNHLNLDEWANEIIESNGLTRWKTYAHFFSLEAVKAGFLIKNKGVWTLTLAGAEAIKSSATPEDYFLKAQAGYKDWKKKQLGTVTTTKNSKESNHPDDDFAETPPEDRFDQLKQEVNSALAAELLERIQNNSWQFFERLVIDVLKAMGYGGMQAHSAAFQRGNDEGIDGFVHQDRLGLETIYVQAKRWAAQQSVGRPDIQQFVGALAGRQSLKGVFITTSRFTEEARQYVKNLTSKVILVDGVQLANYMIEYGVGVSVYKTFEFKRVDSDFFSED